MLLYHLIGALYDLTEKVASKLRKS